MPATTTMCWAIALAFLCILGFAHVPPQADTPFDFDTQLERLASEDEDEIKAACQALADYGNPAHYMLMQQLYNGAVAVWSEREDPQFGLVIFGDSRYTDDADEFKEVFDLMTRSRLADADGNPLEADAYDLTDVETDREIREIINVYLKFIDLTGHDPEKRRNAALELAATGDIAKIALLKKARDLEKDARIARVQTEAIYQLQLKSDDALDRFTAASGLAEIRARNSTAQLEARITPDEEGNIPESDERVRAEIAESIKSIGHWESKMNLVQTVFFGLSLGSILILMALGLAIIYGLLGIINMAHGEFMMIGAYTAFLVQQLFTRFVPADFADFYFICSFPAAFLCAGLFGLLAEFTIIRHLYKRPLESLLATWGLSLLMIQSARLIFGNNRAVNAPEFLRGGFEIFPEVVFAYNRLFIVGVTAATVFGMFLLFYRTGLGMRIRAVTQNRSMSACLGIPTRRVDSLAFFVGTGIAGIAGCALTLIGNIVPDMGQNYIVDSFLVVVTGGVGKLAGTVISGLGLGFATKLAEPLLQAVFAKVFILVLVILFLQVKPTGLFPAKGRLEE
ncbi:MAG: urea transport system permease protein [Rhodothermales bacterium]|jgi:urea transport system permease protein